MYEHGANLGLWIRVQIMERRMPAAIGTVSPSITKRAIALSSDAQFRNYVTLLKIIRICWIIGRAANSAFAERLIPMEIDLHMDNISF